MVQKHAPQWGLILLFLGAAVARAQSRPTLVVVPLELDPNPSLTRFEAQLKPGFFLTLSERSNAIVASKRETEAAIKDTKRQDYRESDESLAKLATSAHVLYALFAVLELTPQKKLVLSGRVVRDDGKLMKAAKVELPKGTDTVVEAFKPLTMQLIAQLGLPTLAPSREVATVPTPPVVVTGPEVEQPPTAVIDSLPPPPPPPLPDEGRRGTGRALTIIGAGVAVVGGGALIGAMAVGGAAAKTSDGTFASSPNSAQQLSTARVLSTVGFVGLGAGVAAAVVGGVLWGTAPSSARSVTIMPTAGGAFVSAQGSF